MAEQFDVFAAAREVPHQLALVEPDRSYSYAELAALSAVALAWLRARGVDDADERASPVAVLALPTPRQIAMTFALMAAGVPVVPVHPRLTEPERNMLIARAGADVYVEADWHQDAPPAHPHDHRARTGEVPLALVQTSGTTAAPRLAVLSERAFRASAEASAAHLGWRAGDRWLLALPFAHIGGLSILTRCLAARSAVALPARARSSGQGAELLARSLGALDVSLLSLVPTQLEQLLELPAWHAPSSLRAVLVGGAAAREATLELARARGLPVLPTYGMTETCSQICTSALHLAPGHAGVGRPLPGVELAIVRGEIQVRGPMLFSGYWGESTPHAASHWFSTGDLGRVDADGCLHVLGRIADRIITGGENVDPLEVEQALAPAVAPRRVCVFGRDDTRWGERVAIAIEGPFDALLIESVTRASRERLATFKRPRLVTFVDELPELTSGKVLRRALKEASALPWTPIRYSSG